MLLTMVTLSSVNGDRAVDHAADVGVVRGIADREPASLSWTAWRRVLPRIVTC
jgi:hypothetical protein